ncbi:hypothetical protein [Neobacillus bataviensis]|uniref:hypothetical protein n=1 Tax=Neobacillus bataviensis TaxID=220685 RepID=UPI001CC00317|nr:hypothetical protein [Neobacillus bataviensis]
MFPFLIYGGGVFWLGSVLFVDFLLMPVISSLEPKYQSAVMKPLGKRASGVMITVSTLTILSGIGIGFKIGIFDRLSTTYGTYYITSLCIAIVLWFWGLFVLTPTEKKLRQYKEGTPEFSKQLAKLKMLIMTELIGMLVLFVFMVLMRFA